jgi:membrane protein implicated in regulation of membrane protease activity
VEMTVPAVLGAEPGLAAVDLTVWLTTIAMVVLLPVAAMVVGQLWRAWRAPSRTGADGLIGRKVVVVRSADGLTGRVRLDGAFWGVRSAGAPLTVGQPVRVRAVDGLELVVEPVGGRAPSELMAALRARLH